MADITDEELKKEVEGILKDADLAETSHKIVMQKLEKKLGVDLADKKKAIIKMVMEYVNNMESEEEEEEEEENEESSEEEERPKRGQQKKPAKQQKTYDDEGSEDEKPPKKKSRKRKGSDGDSDSDWGKKKEKTPKAKKSGGGGGGRGKGGGYTRAYKLSPALADLMGKDEMPRHEVVKRVWAIIKEKNLYDPNNKQFVVCDEALLSVFGTKRFRAFGMMKYLKTHFVDE